MKYKTDATDYGVILTMKTDTSLTGARGESTAARYLETRGYSVLERNARFGRYEIDLVCEDRQRSMIVFVEVKSRSSYDPAYPIRTAVNSRKRSALRKAIARWVNHHQYEGPARIDLVSVAGGRVIEHLLDLGAEFF